MIKTTEQDSNYRQLETMSTVELLNSINREDQSVALAVERAIPSIVPLIDQITAQMESGGRLFYIGAGTSGRLGILDASECPPTYGVPHDWVIGLIAGGDGAIRRSIEHAEDDPTQAWRDLQAFDIGQQDVVVGIAASGTTPYVVGGLKDCQAAGIPTGCICCNEGSPLAAQADYPVEVVVGPEFVTGSTRMKSGTAQKLVLNMISTSVMIRLGRVRGNKMVDMQLSNSKLRERGARMLMNELNISQEKASVLLEKYGSVRSVLAAHKS
ncbi:MAG: N-acetylmuramic acid 6-phosphate etherase [Bacteroidota bacterium]